MPPASTRPTYCEVVPPLLCLLADRHAPDRLQNITQNLPSQYRESHSISITLFQVMTPLLCCLQERHSSSQLALQKQVDTLEASLVEARKGHKAAEGHAALVRTQVWLALSDACCSSHPPWHTCFVRAAAFALCVHLWPLQFAFLALVSVLCTFQHAVSQPDVTCCCMSAAHAIHVGC